MTRKGSTKTGQSSRAARRWQVMHADCLLALPKLDAASVDVLITDPPYGIDFNGMAWDRARALDPARPPGRRRSRENPSIAFGRFCAEWARQCLPVLKPGAHLAAFAAPTTAHLLASGLEEAGFELRDMLMWLHAQGYPAGANCGIPTSHAGWGTRLKPAYEPILLARKPLEGTLRENLARHGTGALHIDACRNTPAAATPTSGERCPGEGRTHAGSANPQGRWPAHLLLSHSLRCTPDRCQQGCPIGMLGEPHRFFYCAKPNRRERNIGCERLPRRTTQTFQIGAHNERKARARPVPNIHPTVKPIELMRWLVRLLTPLDGLVLDPFTGSGTTGIAAILEDARFLGIEREDDYLPIARARIGHWARNTERAGA